MTFDDVPAEVIRLSAALLPTVHVCARKTSSGSCMVYVGYKVLPPPLYPGGGGLRLRSLPAKKTSIWRHVPEAHLATTLCRVLFSEYAMFRSLTMIQTTAVVAVSIANSRRREVQVFITYCAVPRGKEGGNAPG